MPVAFEVINPYVSVLRTTDDVYTTGYVTLRGLGETMRRRGDKLSELGRRYVVESVQEDPSIADLVDDLLNASDPPAAFSKQIQEDLAEALKPPRARTKPIVMKPVVRELLPKVEAAQQAILDAMPYKDTPEAETSRKALKFAKDPKGALESYFTLLALEQVAPWDSPDTDVGMFGLGQFVSPLPWPRSVLAQQQTLELIKAAQTPKPVPTATAVQASPPVVNSAVSNAVSNVQVVVGEGARAAFTPTAVTTAPPPVAPPSRVPVFIPAPVVDYQAPVPFPTTMVTALPEVIPVAKPEEKKADLTLPLVAAAALLLAGKK